MSVTKATMYFALPTRGQGWSETLYTTADPAAAITALQGLLSTRLALLGSDCNVIALRASTAGPPKKGILNLDFLPQPGAAGLPAQDANTCFNYRAVSNVGRYRNMTFRGVPDDWEQDGIRTPLGQGADKLFLSYLAALKLGTFGLAYTDPTAYPISPVLALVTSGLGMNAVFTTDGTFITNLGSAGTVRIRRCRNRIYNAVWRAVPAAGFTAQLLGSENFYVNEPLTQATVQLLVKTVDPLVGMSFVSCGTHKTGRIFNVPHGRRSAQIQRR